MNIYNITYHKENETENIDTINLENNKQYIHESN